CETGTRNGRPAKRHRSNRGRPGPPAGKHEGSARQRGRKSPAATVHKAAGRPGDPVGEPSKNDQGYRSAARRGKRQADGHDRQLESGSRALATKRPALSAQPARKGRLLLRHKMFVSGATMSPWIYTEAVRAGDEMKRTIAIALILFATL